MNELESSREIIIPDDLKQEWSLFIEELKEYEKDLLFGTAVSPPIQITKFTAI